MEEMIQKTNCFYEEMFNRHSDMVWRLCLMYLRNKTDAEDAFQEIFIKLIEKNPFFNDKNHEKAWLIKVTSNLCKDIIRKNIFRKCEDIDDVTVPISENENREVVYEVLKLPLIYRNVIYLYYFEGFNTLELSSMLHIKESTIRSQLKRAREMLKEKLNGGDFDD
jgi:RNA polymerase sigma factor (sigma-70 family)